jgi:hypothetical protein
MTSTVEYLLKNDGSFELVETIRTPIDIGPNVLSTVLADRSIRIPGAVSHPAMGVLGLDASEKAGHVWTIPIPALRLNTRFGLIKPNGRTVLTPTLSSASDPVLDLLWEPPASCLMKLAVMVVLDQNSLFYAVSKSWLFMFDGSARCWRLPIGNLYDDCSVCLGEFEYLDVTSLGAAQRAYNQFWNGHWNADLMTSTKVDQMRRMFRFTPETMAQEPPPTTWADYCYKVANPIVERVILP